MTKEIKAEEKAKDESWYAGDIETIDGSYEPLSPEEDKRILRKLDMCLLPVMALSYLFQYLDKSALASTAIMGLREDLNLTGEEYSWSSGIYYFGYLVASYPAGVLMVRWRVGKFITASILAWGAILMLTATCHNSSGLLATRFFLGVAEAAIAPGLTIIISMFYKRSEQPLRHAAWFLGNTCAGLFGGLLNYGIGHIETIAPWKASFLILGGATVAWSISNIFLLPDTPSNAWFLNISDREKAVARVQENLTGIKNDKFKWEQCQEAVMDMKTWFLVLIQFSSNIPNGGVTTFRSIILTGIGFSTFDTLLLHRTYWMMLSFAVALVGAALVRELPEYEKWGRYAGTCLMGANSASFPLMMSMVSGNIGGFTKKTTVNALSFIAYCAGNIIGPQLFFEREAPSYDSGFIALMVCQAACFMLCLMFRFYLMWNNRIREQQNETTSAADTSDMRTDTIMAMMDKTDKEIDHFRYVY
ncbi:MFS allantoate transporter [Penicillium manginii]|uniref:MFS allantoate transporter n=1 Tax=Penicillium manginii TaxID=203109 RepID=UPI002548BC65|nr:MFS allantoate transporter [Penicillium manginii]KAJ5764585.1 MFS allantoate transporter [Penicillium manginii]